MRGWIGVQVQPVTADIADSLGLKKAEGALVENPSRAAPPPRPVSRQAMSSLRSMGCRSRIRATLPGRSVRWRPARRPGSAFCARANRNLTLTLGQLPSERQAQVGFMGSETHDGGPRLGLTLAPAGDVDGPGSKGVAVRRSIPTALPRSTGSNRRPDSRCSWQGGFDPADIRKDLAELRKAGKHTVLMRVKSRDAVRFVALPSREADGNAPCARPVGSDLARPAGQPDIPSSRDHGRGSRGQPHLPP